MIVWDPTPAAEGLNTPPLTPVPLYVPPEGVPPLNVIEEELTHTLLNVPKLTTGSAFTKIPEVSDDEHPLALV